MMFGLLDHGVVAGKATYKLLGKRDLVELHLVNATGIGADGGRSKQDGRLHRDCRLSQ
jgi:hypothetical protein